MGTKNKIGRILKLGRMTAAVAGDYLGWRIQDSLFHKISSKERLKATHSKVGKRLANTLGDLKGPLMKLGQMASISSGLLPLEIAEPLKVLRKNAPFVSYKVIAEQIEAELGAPPERLFAAFEPQPFAAASIGQVHRAVTDDGRSVAVKVQYPNIDESVDADLAHLRLALKAAGVMQGKKERFRRFFHDVTAQLKEELDYCNEADNVRFLAEYHRERHPFLHIPEVVGERSSARILSLSLIEGDSLDTAAGYPRDVRDLIGERLISFLYSEIIELKALHADPNPANFAFDDQGDIILYDFGCLRRFTDVEHQALKDILKAVFERDADSIEAAFIAIGMRRLDGPRITGEMYLALLEIIAPLLIRNYAFDFGRAEFHKHVIALLPKMRQYGGAFNFTTSMMAVQRVNMGTYGNLRKLGARVKVRDVIEAILD